VNPREMQDYREMSKSSDQSRQRQLTTGSLPPKTADGSRVDPKDDDDGYMTLLGRTASSQKNTDHLYTELSTYRPTRVYVFLRYRSTRVRCIQTCNTSLYRPTYIMPIILCVNCFSSFNQLVK